MASMVLCCVEGETQARALLPSFMHDVYTVVRDSFKKQRKSMAVELVPELPLSASASSSGT